ncbi:DUF4114 domain-containing protein [Methylotenera sp.]|uniref:DUF4114 domain-containing protein n=1 Tax=Methylotenera sp. TaxID=2051956 RepID=UPI0027302A22|nr:DUF4114 domain-containing protein [Methylotenera sp.]MDP2071318.1 DUF4114 domain-containing protein [Methylotenera sp.]MDP3005235.1 DUF4114 domain-containing protein [Methylotenera sp.]MDP3818137.1 DUF4114 domain-containing protein [Methylotenera sp.]
MRVFNLVVSLILMALSTTAMSAVPRPYALTPSTDSLYVATAGEVILTFLSKTASYSSDLYLQGTEDSILNNQKVTPGTQFSLGSFQAGAELAFTIFVKTTGFAYYTGDENKNPDKFIHSAFDITSGQSVNVGFEDIFNGGDRDYDDLVFSLNNVVVGKLPVTPVPEPQTYALLLAGLLMLGAVKRRKS